MKTTLNRISVGLMSVLVSLGLLLGGFNVQAASNYKNKEPNIKAAREIGVTSLMLPLRFNALKNKTVVADVRIRNIETGNVMHEKLTVKLNADGKKTLVVNNLKAGTKYQIKVRVRKQTLDYYSDYSNRRTVVTKIN